ncbi:uncharacterized membrane protein YcaP (DUF421 family) [Peribacillus deserti]|uniref:Uncharacterized membrane protein YcaP (DUF421 family) n=1 Tax=Peribacillus deserti TaxID=673318 RepID=A0ABS2QHC8_9BACI|nr:YetF domain-containing protein [Peribacillus deserti]MBM7692566.1 uncharacterized membrane protein YcaP (DUF421 family) [Peribacillus deserti]
MEFFFGQDQLSMFQWIMRGVIGYLFLAAATKFMGQRFISQLRFIDFITALIVGSIIAKPLGSSAEGMAGPFITTAVISVLYYINTLLTLKFNPWRKLFEPSTLILIKNGKINIANLKKAKITMEYLLSVLRMQHIYSIENIGIALWEPGGAITAFLHTEYNPVSKKDMNIPTEPFRLTKIVIKEGLIKEDALELFGVSREWIEDQMKNNYKVPIKEVILATLDEGKTLKVIQTTADKV